MDIAMTGACSSVARSVIGLLDGDPDVGSIMASDIRPYDGVPSSKIRFRQADIRDFESLKSAFSGAEAVIHLAFVVVAKAPEWRMVREINIEGSKRVMRAAADSGVRKVIYTSSVAAYGAVPGNPPVLTERSPCRGLENEKNFYYSYTKAAVERDLDDFVAGHPGMVVTRFRPHILAGPNILERTGNLFFLSGLGRPSRSLWAFRPSGPNGSLLQCTHEEDLARAIRYALHHDLPGAFNIAGVPLDFEDYLRARGRTLRPIPWVAANALALLLSPISSRARVGRAWLVSAKYRNILDSSKLAHSGFVEPLHTTLECVEEAVAYYGQRRGRRDRRRASRGPAGEEDHA